MGMARYKLAIIGLVIAAILARVAVGVVSIDVVVPVASVLPDTLPTIIIDPGHGGIDGGAVGVDEIIEKDINLALGLILRDIFAINGFAVVMTRETDISTHDEGITGTRRQKVSDMHNRLELSQEHPNSVFLSIHQNKFADSDSRGAQVFYSPNNSESEHLAQILQQIIAENIQPDNKRQHKKAGDNLFLMTEIKTPAVLIECGFLSNPEESRLLTEYEYQARMAFAIFESVMLYLELDSHSQKRTISAD